MRVYQFRHIRAPAQCSHSISPALDVLHTMHTMSRCLLTLACGLVAFGLAASAAQSSGSREIEVVVALAGPPLAQAQVTSRVLTAAARSRRLSLRSPHSVSYLRGQAAEQAAVETRITRAIPQARIRWRYRVVLNALAVVVPAARAGRLAAVPGVAEVYASTRYRARLDRSPQLIGAPDLWSPDLSTAGNGLKIGIIDDGVDHRHPFFDPRGFSAPAGFPRGQLAYTTAKVIVARSFPPPTPAWRHAAKAFDPEFSEHGTHVAGIAAGDNAVVPGPSRSSISGVAPGAFIGNYRVLTIPTASGVGLDGNAPEIAAGIEAAVADGMDVINLSLGEPEIEPGRDLVVAAINNAAAAGVVPVVAAGNDFSEFGRGSVGSPGTAARAITAAAVSKTREIAGFSSGGPTPLSLQLKPEVSAPGVSILSSVPAREGLYDNFSGTSMAAPHVAGAAALLRQRNPTWTVEQIKSALVTTGTPVRSGLGEAPVVRQGGGLVDLRRAVAPLVFTSPATVSFGFLTPGSSGTRAVQLTDAGGGAGAWSVALARAPSDAGIEVRVPESITVPGALALEARAGAAVTEQEHDGYVVLTRGTEQRRIPYWLRVNRPTLGRPSATLRRTGTYTGNTAGRPARVSSYGYPERFTGSVRSLAGPEQVFRVSIARPVSNFGVAILRSGANVRVTPRIVRAGDEQRQVGYTSLPFNLNPYLPSFLAARPASGALRPAPGLYDVVFDTPSRAVAGRFTFRFWIDDTTPPTLALARRSAPAGGELIVRARDAGSGLDPRSLVARVDGKERAAFVGQSGEIRIDLTELRRGRHSLVLQASDYQETRNMENVPQILPNTRRLTATFTIVPAVG